MSDGAELPEPCALYAPIPNGGCAGRADLEEQTRQAFRQAFRQASRQALWLKAAEDHREKLQSAKRALGLLRTAALQALAGAVAARAAESDRPFCVVHDRCVESQRFDGADVRQMLQIAEATYGLPNREQLVEAPALCRFSVRGDRWCLEAVAVQFERGGATRGGAGPPITELQDFDPGSLGVPPVRDPRVPGRGWARAVATVVL